MADGERLLVSEAANAGVAASAPATTRRIWPKVLVGSVFLALLGGLSFVVWLHLPNSAVVTIGESPIGPIRFKPKVVKVKRYERYLELLVADSELQPSFQLFVAIQDVTAGSGVIGQDVKVLAWVDKMHTTCSKDPYAWVGRALWNASTEDIKIEFDAGCVGALWADKLVGNVVATVRR